MKHSPPGGNVANLAAARQKKEELADDQWSQAAREFATLTCRRLTSLYGGPCELQLLTRETTYRFLARYSAEWGTDKVVHRQMRIYIDPATGGIKPPKVMSAYSVYQQNP